MSDNKPVFWHQGLFLQPQHFQLSERYQRSLLAPFQQYQTPHFWGVCKLEMLASSLSHKTCEIQSGEFLFPDGAYVSVPGDGLVAPRSFDEEWVEPDKPFTIYIALHKFTQYSDNVTVVNELSETADVNTRWVTLSNPDEVKDMYVEGPVAQVKSLQHVLKIVFENEKEEMNSYTLIPVAQVIRDGETIMYNRNFLPPTIAIAAVPELERLVKEVRDEVTGRAMQLAAYKSPVHARKDFDANLLRYKTALQALSRFVPRLFHITEYGGVHPWFVYGVLRELIGEISTFTDRVSVLGESNDGARLLPPYDHDNLGGCFNDAAALVTQLLNEITIGPQYLVEMKSDGVAFTADVPAEFFTEHVDFYMIVNTLEDFDKNQQSLLTAAKLSSRDMVETLVERSLPGVGMIYLQAAPPGLPRRPNSYYLRLDVHDDQWPSVQRQENIALLWDEAPEDVKIELVVVRK